MVSLKPKGIKASIPSNNQIYPCSPSHRVNALPSLAHYRPKRARPDLEKMTQWLTSTAKPLIERTYRTYLLEIWKIDRGS